MSFENDLQKILNELTLSDEDRQSYTKDADEIRDYIIDRMKKADVEFSHCFDGTSLIGSYLDRLKIDQPDEFDINIKLKMPYPIKIIIDPKYPGYLFLESLAGSKLTDPITNGVYCISRVKLQDWIRRIINAIFQGNTLKLKLRNGRIFRIDYQGNTVAHTFKAIGINNKKREISFDFVPSFEFTTKEWISERKYIAPDLPWFAVPSPKYPDSKINHFVFKISAPHQEREILKYRNNLKNALRLLKAIRDNNDMPKLASYWIKSVFLNEIDNQDDEFWDKPMGVLIIHMLQCLIKCLKDDYIPFYWNKKSNLLDPLSADLKRSYLNKLSKIFQKLKGSSLNATNENIATIFGC